MKIKLHTQIFIAIIAGGIVGFLLGPDAEHLKIIGDIFIRLLRMIIIPLIMASMITGIVSIGSGRNLGRITFRTAVYYLATTLLAVAVGLVLVNIIKPGTAIDLAAEQNVAGPQHTPPSAVSIISDVIPKNLFAAMADGKVLSVIFFSLLVGFAISNVGQKAKPIASFFEGLNEIMLKMSDWVMRLAPFGVFALMAYTIGTTGLEVLKPLALYMLTVIAGLLVHACLTLPVLLAAIGEYSPIRFIKHMFSAVATAFSTASSAATLPITMDCLEKNVGVSKKIAGFVLPIGATINMDGTALYEAVAAMFIAQAYGITMTLPQQIIIMLTAALASIGAAAIPGAGLITLVIVLKAVGLPLEGIAMILAVDRILDMSRTAVNVWGDSCGTVIVARLEGEKLTEPAEVQNP
jgi:proton glutamate symport protein